VSGEIAVGDGDVGGDEVRGTGGARSSAFAEWGLVAVTEFIFLPGEDGGAEKKKECETQRLVCHSFRMS